MNFLPIYSDKLNFKHTLCTSNNTLTFRLKCSKRQDYDNVIEKLKESNKIELNEDFNLEFRNDEAKQRFIDDLNRL